MKPYGLYDLQDQAPVYYCYACQGEIYPGELCYPVCGSLCLCYECYKERSDLTGWLAYAGDDETVVFEA